jgi:RHS repeat-associated core domain
VLSVTGALTASYTYDSNGNLLSGAGRSVTWTAFNMPATIAQGAASLSFGYDSERNRIRKVSASGTLLYLDGPGLRTERLAGAGGTVTWTDYLPAGGDTIGQRVSRSDGQSWVRYYTKDHLGSIAVITDETGAVAERLSYDPWGKRRNPNGTDDPAGALTSQVSRGFTGHEMLDDVDLVHMNGRVYDPQLGRFLSADPFVKYPASTQGWNRYSYVDNNPLARVDPTGYGWFSKIVRAVVSPFGLLSAVPGFNRIETAVFRNQLAGTALMMSSAFCGPYAAACAAQNAAYLSSVRGGGLGDMAKAAAISYATAMAFQAVGTATNSHFGPNGPPPGYALSGDHIANIIGHATVGCASTAAQGGSCGSGALAAGFGSASGPMLPNLGTVGNLVTHAVVGGAGAVLGGGKFENGAVTAAFGYLFNSCGQNPSSCLNPESKGPGMVDVTLPDGSSMYVPQGAAADVMTDLPLKTSVGSGSGSPLMCTVDCLVESPFAEAGAAAVAAGQPVIPKPIPGAFGSGANTSVASLAFREALPYRMPFNVMGTRVLGGMVGRAVPYAGWGMLATDGLKCAASCR